MSLLVARTARALREPHNWVQLMRFGVIGVMGYLLNLGIYAVLLGMGAHTAALISFVISASNNYFWNRHWTFVRQKGHFGHQGFRFFVVAFTTLILSQLWLLVFLDWLHWGKLTAQAVAIILVTPLSFLGNKLWSFR